MNILFIGDIVGKIGRKAVDAVLPSLREEFNIDVVIANAENLAHGKGVTHSTLAHIMGSGVDFCTSGNHVWDKSEGLEILARPDTALIRPGNYPPGWPGVGEKVLTIGTNSILVINLLGRMFMKVSTDCPFRTLDSILTRHHGKQFAAIIVDFHAETTSEKQAFALYSDGRVSAVLGTHTHVPTADERILPQGTAYMTDVGFVGATHSVLGFTPETGIQTHLMQTPPKPEIPETGLASFCAALITIDPSTGRATNISRIYKEVEL